MRRLISLLTVIAVAVSFSFAQEKEDYSKDPGYVDFGNLQEFISEEENSEVLVDGKLLKMLVGISKEDDPEMAELLNGLKLIKVNSFKVNENVKGKLLDKVKSIDSYLSKNNWDRIVKSTGKNKAANIYVKTSKDNKIIGLAIASLEEDGEANFVNIVGNINLQSVGKITKKFNIMGLDKMKNKKHHAKGNEDSDEDEENTEKK